MRRVLILIFLISAVTAGAQSVPTMRTGTQLVVVDVTVTDKNGAPVRGLKAAEFALRDDGAPQTFLDFQEHPTSAAQALPVLPKLSPGTFTNYVPIRQDVPLNVVLLDLLNTPLTDQAYARRQLETYVSQLQPGTPIAIFVLTSRLIMLQGFTSDPTLLKAAVASKKTLRLSPLMTSQTEKNARQELSDAVEANALSPADALAVAIIRGGMAAFDAEEKVSQEQQRSIYTLDGLNQLGRYLAGFPGRKNLIWFSGSFPINIFPQGDILSPFSSMPSMVDEYRETTNLLAKSQVAVYPVDARGLFGDPQRDASGHHPPGRDIGINDQFAADRVAYSDKTATEQATMRVMAAETGGKAYLNTNDLAGAVEDAIHTGNAYYTLIYSPTNKNQDGKYRRLTVDLERKGYHLAYRQGYFAAGGKSHLPPVDAAAGTPVNGSNVAMKVAMRRGAPQQTQIYFTTSFAPVGEAGGLSPELAAGNSAASTVKGPYRIYRLVLSADPASITAVPNGADKVDLGIEFVALVYNAEGVLQTSTGKVLRGALAKAKYEEMVKTGVQYGLDISVPAKGDFYVRTGVHDLASDRVGALEVPASLIASTSVPAGN